MKQLIRNIKFGFVNQYFYRIVGYNKNNQKFKYVDYDYTTGGWYDEKEHCKKIWRKKSSKWE